jgi:lipoate-protein ligase A
MVVIDTGTAAGEQDMIERRLGAGVASPALACWRYELPAVLAGRGQRPAPAVLARAQAERIEVVTRASGGGAVIAGPWMPSLTLFLPIDHDLAHASLPAGYEFVGEACRRALARLGVAADLARRRTGRVPDDADLGWVCFARLSHGELAGACGRKLLGIAQVRRRTGIAICVGVLLDRPDWEALLRVWLGREDADLVNRLEGLTVSCEQLRSRGQGLTAADFFEAAGKEFHELGLAA